MRAVWVGLLMLALVSPAAASLDEDDVRWLSEVKPLLLDDEQKVLESLTSKEDRMEFRKIFWARRDPDLLTEENELKVVYDKRRAEADKRFYTSAWVPVARSTDALGSQPFENSDPLMAGVPAGEAADMQESQLRQYRDQRERPAMEGGLTDCGIFYIIFGEPDEIQKRPHTIWGSREPQVWTYKEKGHFAFDEACLLPVGNEKARRQVKEQAIVQPTIDYHVKGGELQKKLADMMPKLTRAQELLRTPREDFAVTTETHFLKVDDDRTGVFGLARGDGKSLFREDTTGKVRVIVRTEVVSEAGAAVGAEREMLADVDPDGTFVGSYRVAVKPGSYTLKLAVLDANGGKGSVVTQPLHVPDLSNGELVLVPVIVLQAVEDAPKKDAKHAMEAFRIGDARFVPRFGGVFRPAESLTLFYQFYNSRVDPATQRANAVASVSIQRANGAVVAEAPPDTFDTPVGGTLVGPLSLASYAPGKYTVRLHVIDTVAAKTEIQESVFEVKAPDSAAGN